MANGCDGQWEVSFFAGRGYVLSQGKVRHYALVHWAGFGVEDRTWEPVDVLREDLSDWLVDELWELVCAARPLINLSPKLHS